MATAWTIAPGVSRVLALTLGETQQASVATEGSSSTVSQPTATYATTVGASADITGLTPGQSYRIQVRARDAAGNSSAWSTELIVATPSSVPVPTVAATASVPTIAVTASATAPQSLFTNQTPVTTNVSEGVPVTLATTVTFAAAGSVTGTRFYAPTTVGAGSYVAVLYRVLTEDSAATGQVLGTATFGALTPGTWNTVDFSTPIPVVPGVAYRIAVRTSEGRYTASNNFWTNAPVVNNNITGIQSGTNPVGIGVLRNGTYVTNITDYPSLTYQASNYFVDPLFAVTPSGPLIVGLPTVAAVAAVPAPAAGGLPPTIVMGLSRPAVDNASVLLDAAVTPASGSTISTYLWEITSGLGSLTNAGTAAATYLAPSSGTGTATVRLTVTASDGKTALATMTVAYAPNVVAAENQLSGTARATWDLASPNLGGISTLQGFCDGFSIDKTGTASFKIAQSDGAGWSAEVYRLGYYSGNGARNYGTVSPNGTQLTASQAQPGPADVDPDTSLISADCSGWSTTLTWTPPAWAPSGMYVLRLNRVGGGASHVMFVVRDDARRADLTVLPADSTWTAYNAWGGMGGGMYGGNSLYFGTAVDQYNADCAHYVSYNKPVVNRGSADAGRSYGAVEWSNFFTSEYPMVRFLERNGIDAKYYACLDAAGDSAGVQLIGNGTTRGGSKAAMMLGHNEYWSDGMRSGWEAASAAGVSIFTCASNEVFWRLVGTSNDTAGRPRIWECQKSTINGRGATRPQWTGTWRDPDGAGKGGNNPENKLTGTIFAVNGPDLRSLVVPATGGFAAQPLWRHTSVASLTAGQSYTSGNQILGFEWDTYGPAGVTSNGGQFMAAPDPRTRYCSDATYAISGVLLEDAGDVYTSGNATHRLVVKPGGGNGMVFGTGSMNWAFGCDDANVYQQGSDNVSTVIQQATVNMLVDMGAPPATLMGTLTQPTPVDWFVDAGMTTVVTTAGVTSFSIQAGANVTALPLPISAVASIPTMAVRSGTTAASLTVAAAAAVPVVTVKASATSATLTVTATSSIPSPVLAASTAGTLTLVAATVATPAPTLQTSIALSLSTAPATSSVATPALSTGLQASLVRVPGAAAVPNILASAGSRAQLAVVSATTGVLTPEVETGTSTDVGLAPASATAVIGSMTFRSAATVAPSAVQAVASVPSPGFRSAASAGTLTVQAVSGVGAVTFRSGTGVQLGTVAAEAEVLSPGIVSGSATTVNLAEVEAVADIAQLAFRSATTAILAAIAGTTSVPTLSVRLGVSQTLTVVTATAVVPQPQTSAQTGAGVGLAPVSAQAVLPSMAARTGSSVTGQPVNAQASVPTLAVQVTLVARPNTVTATVTIWQPSLGADAVIQLTAVLAKAGVPLPRLLMIPLIFAHPHSVRITRPKGQVIMKRRPG